MSATCGAGVTAAAGTSLATTYSPRYLLSAKAHTLYEHLGFPYHAFAHCKVFVTAAPRGVRVCVSVPFSGQPLSRPLPIAGLVGHYPTNSLIGRRLIHRLCISRKNPSRRIPISSFSLSFPRLSSTGGQIIDVLLSITPVHCWP